jgi:uncharacterized protein (UPF0218 family)
MPGKPLFDELREAAPLLSVGILTADLMSLGIVTGSAVFDGKTPRENAAFMIDAVSKAARDPQRNGQGRET